MLQFAASDLKEGRTRLTDSHSSCLLTPEAAPRGSSREGLEPRERGKTFAILSILLILSKHQNHMILAILLAAAATVTPEVADSGWISGNTLTTILSILCGAGGIVGGKMWGDRSTKKREEEIRAQIANELRAKITNDPMHIEQSHYQADMKANAAAHTDIFGRLRILEAEMAGIKALVTAKFDGLSAQIMETREMVRSLYDRVCNGKKR